MFVESICMEYLRYKIDFLVIFFVLKGNLMKCVDYDIVI